jgi:hypothetical protein
MYADDQGSVGDVEPQDGDTIPDNDAHNHPQEGGSSLSETNDHDSVGDVEPQDGDTIPDNDVHNHPQEGGSSLSETNDHVDPSNPTILSDIGVGQNDVASGNHRDDNDDQGSVGDVEPQDGDTIPHDDDHNHPQEGGSFLSETNDHVDPSIQEEEPWAHGKTVVTYIPDYKSTEWKSEQHRKRLRYWDGIRYHGGTTSPIPYTFSKTPVPGPPFGGTLTPYRKRDDQVPYLSEVSNNCNFRYCQAANRAFSKKENGATWINCCGEVSGKQCPSRLHPGCGVFLQGGQELRYCDWCIAESVDVFRLPQMVRKLTKSGYIKCPLCPGVIAAAAKNVTLPMLRGLQTWGGGQVLKVKANNGGKMTDEERQKFQENLTKNAIREHCTKSRVHGIPYDIICIHDVIEKDAIPKALFKQPKASEKELKDTAVFMVLMYSLINRETLRLAPSFAGKSAVTKVLGQWEVVIADNVETCKRFCIGKREKNNLHLTPDQKPQIYKQIHEATVPAVAIVAKLGVDVNAMKEDEISRQSLTTVCNKIFQHIDPPCATDRHNCIRMLVQRLLCYFDGTFLSKYEPSGQAESEILDGEVKVKHREPRPKPKMGKKWMGKRKGAPDLGRASTIVKGEAGEEDKKDFASI